jgi:hypothetical protein
MRGSRRATIRVAARLLAAQLSLKPVRPTDRGGKTHEGYDSAMTTTARFLIACTLVLELAALCYGTLMAWLVSVWFLDDAAAAGMRPADWWVIAAKRLVVCAFAAMLTAGCVLPVNRWLARIAGQTASRWPLVTARLFVVSPVCASVVGAIQFGITKPFM